ncbi:MAG: PH domain-containing protein [Bacteroidota bacterium]
MKFSAKKDVAFISTLLIPTIIAGLVALWFVIKTQSFIAFVALLATLAVLGTIFYFWTKTYYEIKRERIYYRAAFLKGNVLIDKIERIKKNSTYPNGGSRPALALMGITIVHSGGKELYISPEDVEGLIAALKASNKKIKVKG